ncbi:MAG: iron-containing alcohol dehydrogenase [Planctomycetota bacterium]|nr:MAG: iron-containing alcohol dehydrogenase [Planctomycetota bacterium]
MMFEFASAERIIFGRGTIREVGSLASGMGSRAIVVTGRSTERAERVVGQLHKEEIKYITFNVGGEPTTTIAKAAVERARRGRCDLVISTGGGSAIDTGKVAAAMLTNSGELEDYLEVVGRGQALAKRAAPHIAIPTTAGTGAEVTRNAVLGVPEHKRKVSMRSGLMLPRIAVVDPELTYSMPAALTASTGLDALTQLMEAYVCSKANPLTDGICREGLRRTGRSLRKAYEDGSNEAAREDMATASLFSGLALANAGLGAVHGFAGPLGGMIHAAHGVICARLLPYVMRVNVRVLQERAADSVALGRYDEIAQLLTGTSTVRAGEGVAWVEELCEALKVPSLGELGLKEEDLATAAANSRKSSSMKGNPIALTDEELVQVLRKSL